MNGGVAVDVGVLPVGFGEEERTRGAWGVAQLLVERAIGEAP